jgi:hypothetical protein
VSADDPGCEQCDGLLGPRSIVASGGAHRVVAPDRDDIEAGFTPDRPVFETFGMTEAVGFLEFGCHDADAPACVYVVDYDASGGEFEFHFCSTACLRAFLSAQVDALEAELAATALERAPLK